MRRTGTLVGCGVVAGALVVGALGWAGASFAAPAHARQGGAPAGGAQQGGAPPARVGPPGGSNAMGNELVEGLKATKGCLGVETAFTATKKSVIFAWFEDKAAAMRWYESDVHQTLMMGMKEGAAAKDEKDETGETEERVPMAGVPDGVPVMCIATITPSAKPMVPGFPMPISQVSIELYTPLPGGLSLNGKFAPAALQVNGMVEHTMSAPVGAPGSSGAGGK